MLITAPEETSQRTWVLTCPPIFLAHDFEKGPLQTLNGHHVGHKSRVHLDGQARRKVDSEMVMCDQHDAAVRHNLGQRFPDEFGIGVREDSFATFHTSLYEA